MLSLKRTPNHITPHLKSLHWLKITQRIQYKILSLTYKSLQFKQPSSILDLLKIQPTHSTRSSAVATLQRPSNPSRLKITDRSFYHQAPALWNSLPQHLRALSSASPTQTNNLSPLTVFFSIPQTTENLPFPSILSSLDYLLSGLTLWNSTRPDLNVIHTPFHFSFISTSFIALLFFLIHDVVSVLEKADRNSFLSALWCTLNLPHSLTLLISPHFITCFVNHS